VGKAWVKEALAELSDPTYDAADPTVMQPVGFLQLVGPDVLKDNPKKGE